MSGASEPRKTLADEEPGGDAAAAPCLPRYVRILAIVYVLSRIVGPLGFFLITGVGHFLWVRQEMQIDGWVLGFWIGGAVWLLAGVVFRWWFPRWGRKHWPETESVSSASPDK
jgi:hypothetical protein